MIASDDSLWKVRVKYIVKEKSNDIVCFPYKNWLNNW